MTKQSRSFLSFRAKREIFKFKISQSFHSFEMTNPGLPRPFGARNDTRLNWFDLIRGQLNTDGFFGNLQQDSYSFLTRL